MFPDELMNIISKYKNDNQAQIRNIESNLCEIINSLKTIRNNMASNLYKIMTSDNISDTTEIMSDINLLKEQISYIESFTLSESTEKENITMQYNTEELSEEISTPMFTKKVYPYLISDDLCPFCNVKLVQHRIYYQRIKNNKIYDESVIGYKCQACNKLFVIDYEIKDFDFENTNIILNKDKYDEIPQIDIYTIIVLSNTIKCSSNHEIKDIVAKLPVLNEYGQISYISVNAAYCPICKRFTILKDDFNSIKEIVICKVIDETILYSGNKDSEIEIDQGQSILTQYGYNVQTKKDLSEQQRHIILSSIVEAQILTRREVIDHITTLIERGSKIPAWKMATKKWKEDRQFVSEYKSDSLPEVIFNNIILKYKRTI